VGRVRVHEPRDHHRVAFRLRRHLRLDVSRRPGLSGRQGLRHAGLLRLSPQRSGQDLSASRVPRPRKPDEAAQLNGGASRWDGPAQKVPQMTLLATIAAFTADVVEQRGERLLLPLPCGLPYAAQRLGHANPALSPVRALLIRVSLGPRPWLHRLRHRSPGFVRRLHSYYARVRLLWIVHQRLRLLAFAPRTVRPRGPMADPISRFPYKERPYMPASHTTPGRTRARSNAHIHLAFR
jgi:hypothetical protein